MYCKCILLAKYLRSPKVKTSDLLNQYKMLHYETYVTFAQFKYSIVFTNNCYANIATD